jgi:predicted dehydrogenase
MKELNLGLIGFGYIGKLHTTAYKDIPLCISQPLVTANPTGLLRSRLDTEVEAMHGAGFSLVTTSPDEFYAQPMDLVDICTPNDLHLEQCQRALGAHVAVYCEKPLARTYEETRILAALAEKTGAITQVAYVMRYVPAIRQMKALIEAGEIGRIFHFRSHMFHGSYLDPNRPMSWRLRRAQSGGGAFMDLGAHLVDLTHYLLGRVASVRANMRTLISERLTSKQSDRKEIVDVDDWALATLELGNGAVGVIEVTRMAAGASRASGFEVYGSQGALIYTENNPDAVRYFSLKRGEWVNGPAKVPPLQGERPIEQLWPTSKYSQGFMVNAHLAAQYDLLLNVSENKLSQVDFKAGAEAQAVIEAAYISAERGGSLYRLE